MIYYITCKFLYLSPVPLCKQYKSEGTPGTAPSPPCYPWPSWDSFRVGVGGGHVRGSTGGLSVFVQQLN